jgi:spermidine synthase
MSHHPPHPVEISEQDGVRFLHFGSRWIQGAMRIARPYKLELSYTRSMAASLLLQPVPKRILMVGLGTGSLLRFMYRYRPDSRITVMEIDPRVVDLRRTYFPMPDDPERVRVIVGDAAESILQGNDRFDLALIDGFDAEARSPGLDGTRFYHACRARLARAGTLAVNLFSGSRRSRGELGRLRTAFDGQVKVLPPCPEGNIIAFAFNGADRMPGLAALQRRASALREESGLDAWEIAMQLAE